MDTTRIPTVMRGNMTPYGGNALRELNALSSFPYLAGGQGRRGRPSPDEQPNRGSRPSGVTFGRSHSIPIDC